MPDILEIQQANPAVICILTARVIVISAKSEDLQEVKPMQSLREIIENRRWAAAVTFAVAILGGAWWCLADDTPGNYVFETALLDDAPSEQSTNVNDAAAKLETAEFQIATDRTAPELAAPIRLEADGEPIDIGKLSSIAHAGPAIADVDGDGDRDLLVGDFPGCFWYFQNNGTDQAPQYASLGKLQAGGVDAKTPVY